MKTKSVLRAVLALAMISVGILHFRDPAPFVKIVPAMLPAPTTLVYVSGFFEVLGGVGLLVRQVRSAAGWGLVALYVSVFPANVNMAIHHISLDDAHPIPTFALWLRLPLQAVLIGLAYWVSRPDAVDRDRTAR